MKINIGAGTKRHAGYVNCDYDLHYQPEHVFDMEKDTWPFEDNSVTNIIAHHVLEHLGEGYFHTLKEMYRICRPGAIIDIRVPHWNHANFHHDPTHRRAVTPYGLMLFSKKFNDIDAQNNGASSKLGHFFNVNFEIIQEDYTIDYRYKNSLEHFNREQLLEYANTRNGIIDEVLITLAVVKGSEQEQIQGYYASLIDREPTPEELSTSATPEEIRAQLMSLPECTSVQISHV
jgi:predicted SAM-dependent methyltransferase